MNSTFTVPLPGGGLASDGSVNVAFTFDVDTRGTFWFAYDVDATTTTAPQARRAALRSTRTDGRTSAHRSTTRRDAATVTGQLR